METTGVPPTEAGTMAEPRSMRDGTPSVGTTTAGAVVTKGSRAVAFAARAPDPLTGVREGTPGRARTPGGADGGPAAVATGRAAFGKP